ncbi:hypothetical protein CsSME_00005934 [Camellia sinensis var. sinensis]
MSVLNSRFSSVYVSFMLYLVILFLFFQLFILLVSFVGLIVEIDGDVEPIKQEENSAVLTSKDMDLNEIDENHDNCNTNSLGSWKDAADLNDTADTNSLGSWKDEASGWSDPAAEASSSETVGSAVVTSGSPRVRMSWADMAQEDELEEEEEENEVNGQPVNRYAQLGEATVAVKVQQKPELSREQREYIRFSNVKRKKDFICLERFKGKIVNILEGLELHTGVFSAAEQKRIVDFVYSLQERGKKGELKGQSIQPTASPSNSDVMLVKCF